MGKKITAAMGILAIMLTAGVVFVFSKEDRKGPEIIFSIEPVYTGEEDTAYLLEGVTAVDACDGDVTDSLRVERVHVNEKEQQVTVIYIAKDKSNNVAKVSKTIPA